MSTFVVEYSYTPESSSGRDDHRTDHRAWLAEMIRRGIVRSSGPLADHTGAKFIVESTDLDTASRLFTYDPFVRAHLVKDVRVVEWSPPTDDSSD